MSIIDTLIFSFWFTIGCGGTLIALGICRDILISGLTSLQQHLRAKRNKIRQEQFRR